MERPILEVKDLKKCFPYSDEKGEKAVLKGVDIVLSAGEVFGFLGNNGSGKTTTIKIILGITIPDNGIVNLFGAPINNHSRARIGFAQERTAFYSHLSALEILHFNGELMGMEGKVIQARSEELLTKLNLWDRREERIRSFSKGMKQRLSLACALLHDPDLIILDEPATGLDPFGRGLVKSLILELKGQGKAVFFSSHHLGEVEEVSDRIGILVNGVIKENLQVGEWSERLDRNGKNYRSLEQFFMECQEEPPRE